MEVETFPRNAKITNFQQFQVMQTNLWSADQQRKTIYELMIQEERRPSLTFSANKNELKSQTLYISGGAKTQKFYRILLVSYRKCSDVIIERRLLAGLQLDIHIQNLTLVFNSM